MNFIIQRTTRKKLAFQIFIAACVPIHFGGIFHYFLYFSANILKYNFYELIGIAAYTSLFMLLDCSIILIVVFLIAVMIPDTLWKRSFAAIAIVLIFLVTLHAIIFYFGIYYFFTSGENLKFSLYFFGILVTSFLSLSISAGLRILKTTTFEDRIFSFIDRLYPLLGIYFFFDLLGVIIIFLRSMGIN